MDIIGKGNLLTETLPSKRDIAQQENHCLAVRYTEKLRSAGLKTKKKYIVNGIDGARNQDRRCCQRATAVKPTCPDRSCLADSRGTQILVR